MKKTLGSILLALVFSLLIVWKDNPLCKLRPDLNDLPSNITNGYLFAKHGLAIYSKPTEQFLFQNASAELVRFRAPYNLESDVVFFSKEVARPVIAVWPVVPRSYPPAAYALFAPLSFVYHTSGIDLKWICLFAIFMFLFVGHFVFFKVLEHRESITPWKNSNLGYKITVAVFLVFCYFEILRVSMLGSYDIFSIFFIVTSFISLQKKDFVSAFALLSVALLFHIRALYYLPIFIFILLGALSEEGYFRGVLKKWSFWVGVISLSAFAVFFLILSGSLKGDYPVTNPLYLLTAQARDHHALFVWLPFTLLLFFFIYRLKNTPLLITTLWMTFMLVMSPYFKSWYCLFLVPIFLFSVKAERPTLNLLSGLFFFVLTAGSFFSNSPFEFQFLRELL